MEADREADKMAVTSRKAEASGETRMYNEADHG